MDGRESRNPERKNPGRGGNGFSPLEALRAITIDAAFQYFEEDRKGSLEVGKLADLVILSDNPTTVPPEDIKDIKIVETLKEGNTIFRAENL